MSTALVEAPEAVDADLGTPPPCFGPTHHLGLNGHEADKPAAFLCGAPCGITWFACAGWVNSALEHLYIECEKCGHHLLAGHTFVPLGDMGIA